MKQFLTSGPAILAALQIQNAFEMQYTKDDCERMIENYAYWGGDAGLTEEVMRDACGMPQRDVRDVSSRAAAVIVVEDPPGEASESEGPWSDKVLEAIVTHLLAQKKLDITEPMLTRMNFKALVKKLPNKSKEELLADMQDRNLLITSRPRGKTGNVFVPRLSTQVALNDLVRHEDRTCCPRLPEQLAVKKFETYVFGHASRAGNAKILADVYSRLSKRPQSTRVGRLTAAARVKKEQSASKSEKMLKHEHLCESFLQSFQCSNSSRPETVKSQSPVSKRYRAKGPSPSRAAGSQEVKEEPQVKQELEARDSGLLHKHFQYIYPSTTALRTRRIVDGLGAQKFTRRAQMVLLAGTHDLDISNCVFTLLSQLVQRLEVSPPMPEALNAVFTKCAESRDEICSDLKMSTAEGKQLLVSILYGAAVPDELQGNQLLINLSKLSLYLRWLAISLLGSEFARFCSTEVNKKNPDMSILSHLYLATEDLVLTSWHQYLQKLQPSHLSLHFDGIRISPIEGLSMDDLCEQSAAHIAKDTGFHVVIREKMHRTVLQCIQHAGEKELKMPAGTSSLERAGNCIPAAVASLVGSETIEQALLQEEEAEQASHPGSRSYKECEVLCRVKLVPCLRFSVLPPGRYLFHSESGGQPHCVGLHLKAEKDGLSLVHDIDASYKLKLVDLAEAVESGVDSLTCVFFQVCCGEAGGSVQHDLLDAEIAALLNLEASGAKRPASCVERLGDALVDVEPLRASRQRLDSVPADPLIEICSSPSEPEVLDVASDSELQMSDSELQMRRREPDEESEAQDSKAGLANCMDDDGLVLTDQSLLQDLAKEVSSAVQERRFQRTDKGFACPCCPWRCFRTIGRVAEHLSKYHVEKNQFCVSGTKQLKCVLSLHDADMISAVRRGNYLQRSAALLRDQVQPPLLATRNSIDKDIRFVLDCGGVVLCI